MIGNGNKDEMKIFAATVFEKRAFLATIKETNDYKHKTPAIDVLIFFVKNLKNCII